MIQISRDGQKIKLAMEGGPLNKTYVFFWNCNDEDYAELLAIHFDRKLDKMIQGIRESEYNNGYKDGRAKRGKRTWFSPLIKIFN